MGNNLLRVVGARPQFMQVPTVSRALEAHGFTVTLLHTGQHYDATLNASIFSSLSLPCPDIVLNVGSGEPGWQLAEIIKGVEHHLMSGNFAGVLVDGDTNSTLGAALAAAKQGVPLFHIEGGHRSLVVNQPEDLNRMLSDRCATLNFTPTAQAKQNLVQEGLGATAIHTGDVLIDCLLAYLPRSQPHVAAGLGVASSPYAVMTVHRAEHTTLGEGAVHFYNFLRGAAQLPIPVILPVHPRTTALIERYKKDGDGLGNILLVEPLPYLAMIGLLQEAALCITDSGGLQRESLALGVPTAVLGDNSWPDFVTDGLVYAAGFTSDGVAQSWTHRVYADKHAFVEAMGAGHASAKIAQAIATYFGA